MNPRITLLASVVATGLGCANPSSMDSTATSSDTTGLGCGPDVETGLAVGDCAPDFSMPNRDGVEVTLYSQRGKVALVDISAIW
jgi:cytochrome oxidase Cu insertion factor (SCO1/SenC/PrrC family)